MTEWLKYCTSYWLLAEKGYEVTLDELLDLKPIQISWLCHREPDEFVRFGFLFNLFDRFGDRLPGWVPSNYVLESNLSK